MARDDPSHHLTLADYWALGEAERRQVHPPFDKDFERHLLLNLGLAARMVPVLWDGLATPQPEAVDLDLDQAFAFLNESAWVLEEAGFKVVVPAWWTPQGQRRFKLRLRLSSSSATSTGGAGASGLKLTNLIEFHYQLAIGDQVVSEEEWRRLVQAKTPLVRFRGQWVMLDQDKLQEMLAFWQRHGQAGVQMSLPEILRRTAEDDGLEVDRTDVLGQMLERLRKRTPLEPVASPPGLKAELRAYQQRGLAWLAYLEQMGLNGCLADDMGFGKTMQAIARLVQERVAGESIGPTLLIAPTSVLGNWEKEIQRFAPQLTTLIHHGSSREQDPKAFRQRAKERDLVITSYALVRKEWTEMALPARTWWGQRFLRALEGFTDPRRLQRGRSYAGPSRLLEFGIQKGVVSATVRGNINPYFGVYKEPRYRTSIQLSPIAARDWKAIIAHLGSRADLVAKLLMNEMPDNIDEALAEAHRHLLPVSRNDFKQTQCSCPDDANPCKHIAGVYYRLAVALDRDPLQPASRTGRPAQRANTPEAALQGIRNLVAEVVADLKNTGEAVPIPLAEKRYSGEFRVRIPPELHRALAIQAAEQGVSLNRLVSAKLAASRASS